jgi:hypothetical protein
MEAKRGLVRDVPEAVIVFEDGIGSDAHIVNHDAFDDYLFRERRTVLGCVRGSMSTLSDWSNAIERISAKSNEDRRKHTEAFRAQTEAKNFSKESDEDLLELFVRSTNGANCFFKDEREVWEIALGKIKDELLRRLR